MAITVTILDDHPAILAGVRGWFAAADPPITVLAEGDTLEAAWTRPGADADVVILDLGLLGEPAAGTARLRKLVEAGRSVVIYTMSEDVELALHCVGLGAQAYVTKREGQGHLVAAARSAARSELYLSPTLAGALADDRRKGIPALSDREREALIQWFQSESKQLVAVRMGLSVRTVQTYLDRARQKYVELGRPASTKAALLACAIQDGLVDLEEL